MTEYAIKCPHCGSTELQSNDLIGATCGIDSWSIEAGELTPEFCGESDVDWDSQSPANPALPYQCGECFKLLSAADLVPMLPKEAQGLVAPLDDRVNLTKEQAFNAIRARINGVFDNPDLLRIGALSVDSDEDVLRIIQMVR